MGPIQHIEQSAKQTIDGAAAVLGGGSAIATILGYLETGLGLILVLMSIALVGLRLKLAWDEHKENKEKKE